MPCPGDGVPLRQCRHPHTITHGILLLCSIVLRGGRKPDFARMGD
jgi:hypothetical protein